MPILNQILSQIPLGGGAIPGMPPTVGGFLGQRGGPGANMMAPYRQSVDDWRTGGRVGDRPSRRGFLSGQQPGIPAAPGAPAAPAAPAANPYGSGVMGSIMQAFNGGLGGPAYYDPQRLMAMLNAFRNPLGA